MTDAERSALAKTLVRVSLSLPKDHEAHPHIDAAVDALMGLPKVIPFRRPDHQPTPPSAA